MIRAALFLMLFPGLAQAACRQALTLGLDVSSSVDDTEYQLQIDGVVAALTAPDVQDILFMQPDIPIRLHVFEWSGPPNQTVIVPWTDIRTPADLVQIIAQLEGHSRAVAAPTTAIGSAILAGYRYLEDHSDCWKRTIDLSGDGETNTGPLPQDVPESARPIGVTVNGLVIGAGNQNGGDNRFVDIKQLTSYYRANVIRGPGAFVETAQGYADYAAAMERKLLRELASIAIGSADIEAFDANALQVQN